jgi:hypothetical protein
MSKEIKQSCPICGGNLDPKNFICTSCNRDIIDFNLTLVGEKVDLIGNGMSMQAGILIASSFGFFSILQILWIKELLLFGHQVFFLLLIMFEILGYYTIYRFVDYRKQQIQNEAILLNLNYLKYTDYPKLKKELIEFINKDYPTDVAKKKFPIKQMYFLLKNNNIKHTYIIWIIIFDLIILFTNPYIIWPYV